MKTLQTLLLGCLLVGILAPAQVHASPSHITSCTVEAPDASLPVSLVAEILDQALVHVKQDMGSAPSLSEAIRYYYISGQITITTNGNDPASGQEVYQVVYLDCSVLVLVDEF